MRYIEITGTRCVLLLLMSGTGNWRASAIKKQSLI